jgi:HSP20 family protein
MAKESAGAAEKPGAKPKEADKPAKKAVLVPVVERPVSPFESDFDRFFDRFFEDFPRFRVPSLLRPERLFPAPLGLRTPAVDIFEDKNDVVVKAELPGIGKEEVEVSVTDNAVTLKGEKRRKEEVKEQDYHRIERSYGAFVRTVGLPAEVKASEATAKFSDGVLEIRIPKSEAAKRSVVKVAVK